MIQVDFLKDHPQHVETVARWIFSAWGDGTPEGRERAVVRVRERLRDDAVPLTLIALDGDTPVGTVSLFEHDLDGWDQLTPWLAALYVPDEHRSSGVGTALAARLEMVARTLGYDEIFLQAQDARDYYAERGWRVVGLLETDRGRTAVMQKDLRGLPTILYRADAGHAIGLGHVMHAARLDTALRSRGIASVQVAGELDEMVARMLEDAGMLRHVHIHSVDDVGELLLIADAHDVDVVAFNLPKALLEANETVFVVLRDEAVTQIHFDDPMSTAGYADLVVNALPHPDWEADLESHPDLHEGLEYFLLSDDFARSASRATARVGQVSKILISMGGSDPEGLTPIVLAALAEVGFRGSVDVVTGVANEHGDEVVAAASDVPFEVRTHDHLPSLAELAASADLAFSALGLTTYEFASVGLPVVILAGSELNARVADLYATEGAALSLGYYRDWTPVRLAARVAAILGDPAALERMSRRGPQLVDGKGADRVCALIEPLLQRGTDG